jgi:hypothetical protein
MSSPNTQPTSAPDISREGQARSPAVSGTPRDEHTDSPAPPGGEAYPEQKHAGAVGYGPNYHHGPVCTDCFFVSRTDNLISVVACRRLAIRLVE